MSMGQCGVADFCINYLDEKKLLKGLQIGAAGSIGSGIKPNDIEVS